MSDKLLFLKNFVKHPLQNASIIPSSKFAAKSMIKGIDFSKIKVIVELGPGNGVVTSELLNQAYPNTKIIVFEIEPSYFDLLQQKFGDKITLMNRSAHLLQETLEELKIEKVDLVVSGLPFLKGEVKQKTDASIKAIASKGAIYRFFTYMPGIMKKVYHDLPIEKKQFQVLNFPPMWVYGIN